MRLKASGLNQLYRNAIKGYNSMPLRGACVTCSDNDIISAVDYILNKSLSRSQWLDAKSNASEQKHAPSGEDVYNDHCAICHNDGKQGAPKIGDKAIWKPLIAKTFDVLVENASKGKNHPSHGGCKDCTNGEIIDAVKYMVNQSKTTGDYKLW